MISVLIVIYIVFISLGLPDSLFGASWPVIHLDFGIAESFASVYSIITGICSGGAGFLAGKLLRKYGTVNVTFVSILLTAFGLLGCSLSSNIWIMMIFSIVLGYGQGAIDTGLNNYVSLHYKAQHMNWLHCFWGIGVTVSPLIMSRFLAGESNSWKAGYRIIALMQLLIALIVLCAMKKWKRFDVAAQSKDEKIKEKMPKLSSFKGIIPSILSIGLYFSMESIIGTWGATFLVNTASLAPDSAAKWISAYFCGIMLGRFVGGFASMKLCDSTLVSTGLAISFFGFFFLLSGVHAVPLIGLILIGFGFGPVFPSVLHSVPERFGNKFSADITGIHMGAGYALGFAIQLGFGFTASGTTFKIMPFVLMTIGVLAFLSNAFAVRGCKGNCMQD